MKKKIIIISALLLIFHCAIGQQKSSNDPIKDMDFTLMNKFNGTWEWKTSKESLTIILKTAAPTPGNNLYLVFGWYRFEKNGKVIIDELADVENLRTSTFAGYSKKGDSLLHFSFTDKSNNKLRHGFLSFIDGSQTSALLTFENEKYIAERKQYRKSQQIRDTIPSTFKIILKKLK
jgi:hypothetical protein